LAVSHCEKKIGVVLGRKLIKNKQEITELAIYKKQVSGFKLEKLITFEH